MEKVEILQEEDNESIETPQLPFILNFLEYRKGARAWTTTGTFDDIDASDHDN